MSNQTSPEARIAAREVAADSRDVTADSRDVTADSRDVTADSRDVTANTRDETADSRDVTADSRDMTADSRDVTANTRDETADSRDATANARDLFADFREETADTRELHICVLEMKQAAHEARMSLLQQVNEHMMIAAMETKKLMDEIQTTKTELLISKAVAEKANLAKSDFLSSMSHELRSPLNAILGFAQLMEGGSPAPTEAQAVRLHQITKAGWYLLELINQILDLAVIESSKFTLSREPVLVIEVIRECQSMIETQAQEHGVRVDFLPFDWSLFVNADRMRMKQVLINLLSNAIKYNRKEGTVVVACTANHPEHIRISIKDTGEGLPPEKLRQLFQPFNRLGQEHGVEQGTGIGLIVTKQLIELMGGSISVKSTVGEGSEFCVDLIRDVSPPQMASSTPSPDQILQPCQPIALHTLLYVEDNPANLMLVEQIIEGFPDVHMLSARDALVGIALARAHLPDVILMDINLPGINGFEALKILLNSPSTMHIPVIALSANAMRRDVEKGLEAGFFRYLTKPIKLQEFMNSLEEALDLSKTKHPNMSEKPS
ncbi:MAG: ATP-binding protein [Gallionella sp.]|nr:ATP-binding protein [Gallionella sp.]